MPTLVASMLLVLAHHARDEGHYRLAARMLGSSQVLHARLEKPVVICSVTQLERLELELSGLLGSKYAGEHAAGGRTEFHDLLPEIQAWLEGTREKHKALQATAVLTAREHEVLQCLEQGASDKRIAQILSISTSTVSKHVANMLGKLGLHNRVELARWAAGHRGDAGE